MRVAWHQTCPTPGTDKMSPWAGRGEKSRASWGSQVWWGLLAPALHPSGLGFSGWVGWRARVPLCQASFPSSVSVFLEFDLCCRISAFHHITLALSHSSKPLVWEKLMRTQWSELEGGVCDSTPSFFRRTPLTHPASGLYTQIHTPFGSYSLTDQGKLIFEPASVSSSVQW